MRLTQGTFSFLPDLTDTQIAAQVQYCLDRGWAVNIEHTDEPHPRNTYWEMWGQPMFDVVSTIPVLEQVEACRSAFPENYVRVSAFDSTKGWESIRLSFLVHRPDPERGFVLIRGEDAGRRQRYAIRRANGWAAAGPNPAIAR